MKKNVLIIVIVVVLIVAGVGAWYFLKGNNNPTPTPASSTSKTAPSAKVTTPSTPVAPTPQSPSVTTPAGEPTFSQAYNLLTKAQKDCLLNALGQKKLDGFIKNDQTIMQTITSDDYQKAAECQQ